MVGRKNPARAHGFARRILKVPRGWAFSSWREPRRSPGNDADSLIYNEKMILRAQNPSYFKQTQTIIVMASFVSLRIAGSAELQ
jgi:hypothetical protein